MCWEKGKNIRFFMNGMPWPVGISVGQDILLLSAEIDSANELVVSAEDNGKVDRLRIYGRALKTSEVYDGIPERDAR